MSERRGQAESAPEAQAEAQAQARDGIAGLDPLLHHPSRLGALVLLSNVDAMAFSRLKTLLGETDGNLGAQLRKLEEAAYVAVKKEFVERRPVSWYSLSAAGRKALRSHLGAMRKVIESAG
jgi:DNA-binding MarR family transcriptional regulator